jgi:hypothetical protein
VQKKVAAASELDVCIICMSTIVNVVSPLF